MFGKKGDVTVGALFLIVIIILFFVWAVTYSAREYRTDNDCSKNSYCASDFSCHKHPVIIEEKIVQSGVPANYTTAAFLLGLSIVIAAIILRKKNGNGNGSSGPSHQSRIHPSHDEHERKTQSSHYFEHYAEDAPAQDSPKHHH